MSHTHELNRNPGPIWLCSNLCWYLTEFSRPASWSVGCLGGNREHQSGIRWPSSAFASFERCFTFKSNSEGSVETHQEWESLVETLPRVLLLKGKPAFQDHSDNAIVFLILSRLLWREGSNTWVPGESHPGNIRPHPWTLDPLTLGLQDKPGWQLQFLEGVTLIILLLVRFS